MLGAAGSWVVAPKVTLCLGILRAGEEVGELMWDMKALMEEVEQPSRPRRLSRSFWRRDQLVTAEARSVLRAACCEALVVRAEGLGWV